MKFKLEPWVFAILMKHAYSQEVNYLDFANQLLSQAIQELDNK